MYAEGTVQLYDAQYMEYKSMDDSDERTAAGTSVGFRKADVKVLVGPKGVY